MPLICVIVPVYNAERYLAPCIESILAQTYEEFALVLVDDGSVDRSPQVCGEYAALDERVVAISQENKGAAAARNRGIEWALAQDDVEYLAFVDSDDWIHPEYLTRLYEGIVSTGCKLSMCCAETVETRECCLPEASGPAEVQTPEYLWCIDRGLCVVPWGKLYATSLFETIRFPEYTRAEEDEFVSYRVLFACDQVCFMSSKLYAYYQSAESVMRSTWTPKRMVGFDAEEEQLVYFYTNGYRQALHEAANTYIYSMHHVLKSIEPMLDDEEYFACAVELKKRLRKTVKDYFQLYGFPILGNEWVYAFRHPVIARMIMGVKKMGRVCADMVRGE